MAMAMAILMMIAVTMMTVLLGAGGKMSVSSVHFGETLGNSVPGFFHDQCCSIRKMLSTVGVDGGKGDFGDGQSQSFTNGTPRLRLVDGR